MLSQRTNSDQETVKLELYCCFLNIKACLGNITVNLLESNDSVFGMLLSPHPNPEERKGTVMFLKG